METECTSYSSCSSLCSLSTLNFCPLFDLWHVFALLQSLLVFYPQPTGGLLSDYACFASPPSLCCPVFGGYLARLIASVIFCSPYALALRACAFLFPFCPGLPITCGWCLISGPLPCAYSICSPLWIDGNCSAVFLTRFNLLIRGSLVILTASVPQRDDRLC